MKNFERRKYQKKNRFFVKRTTGEDRSFRWGDGRIQKNHGSCRFFKRPRIIYFNWINEDLAGCEFWPDKKY